MTHPDFALRRNVRASIVGEDSIGAAQGSSGSAAQQEFNRQMIMRIMKI